MFQYSRILAMVFGVCLPVLETIRRFPQLGNFAIWPYWLDDFLLSALLLSGARLTSNLRYHNAKFLAAAWGVTCGMAYGSFFGSILELDVPDPAPIPTIWVAAIKGLGFALAIVALAGSLKHPRLSQADELLKHPGRLNEMLDATDDA